MSVLKRQSYLAVAILLGFLMIVLLMRTFQGKIQLYTEQNIQVDLEEIQKNARYLLNSEIDNFASDVQLEARTLNRLGPLSEKELQAELKSFPRPASMLRMHVLSSNGRFYSSLDNQIRQYNPEHFQDVLSRKSGTFISSPRFSDTFRKMVIEVATPLYLGSAYSGILVGCYDITVFETLLRNNFLKGDCTIEVLSHDGQLISRSSTDENDADSIPSYENIFSYYEENAVHFNISSHQKMQLDLIQGNSGFIAYEENGTTRYVSYAPSEIDGWYVTASATDKTLHEQSSVIKQYAFELTLGVFLVLLCITLFILMSHSREQVIIQHLLEKAASTDALTKLFNRAATEEQIHTFLTNEGASGNHALFMLDIDGFKMVNDRLGHIRGDEILSHIGQSLLDIFDGDEFVGRIGGDEFMILIPNYLDKDYLREKAHHVCNAIEQTFQSEDHPEYQVKISASIGIALYPQDGSSFHELYGSADIALYECKRRGKNQSLFYEDYEKKEFE